MLRRCQPDVLRLVLLQQHGCQGFTAALERPASPQGWLHPGSILLQGFRDDQLLGLTRRVLVNRHIWCLNGEHCNVHMRPGV